jgi:hypothetical protein
MTYETNTKKREPSESKEAKIRHALDITHPLRRNRRSGVCFGKKRVGTAFFVKAQDLALAGHCMNVLGRSGRAVVFEAVSESFDKAFTQLRRHCGVQLSTSLWGQSGALFVRLQHKIGNHVKGVVIVFEVELWAILRCRRVRR